MQVIDSRLHMLRKFWNVAGTSFFSSRLSVILEMVTYIILILLTLKSYLQLYEIFCNLIDLWHVKLHCRRLQHDGIDKSSYFPPFFALSAYEKCIKGYRNLISCSWSLTTIANFDTRRKHRVELFPDNSAKHPNPCEMEIFHQIWTLFHGFQRHATSTFLVFRTFRAFSTDRRTLVVLPCSEKLGKASFFFLILTCWTVSIQGHATFLCEKKIFHQSRKKLSLIVTSRHETSNQLISWWARNIFVGLCSVPFILKLHFRDWFSCSTCRQYTNACKHTANLCRWRRLGKHHKSQFNEASSHLKKSEC